MAEAGRTLAYSLVELGKLAESLDEAKAVSFTSLGMATLARQYSERGPEARREALEGAPGFAGTMGAEVGDFIANALKSAPNERARELYEERAGQFRTSFFSDNVTFEAKAGRKKRLVDFDNRIDEYAVAVFNDPGTASKLLALARGDLEAAAKTWMLPGDVSERR